MCITLTFLMGIGVKHTCRAFIILVGDNVCTRISLEDFALIFSQMNI